mmetsp:Transcript_82770/g.246955  ORF Transcript_82770/g.246955 Transcript_82770/m.246955 type:complete len:543 (-) Transcript_82770:232-1860(-)
MPHGVHLPALPGLDAEKVADPDPDIPLHLVRKLGHLMIISLRLDKGQQRSPAAARGSKSVLSEDGGELVRDECLLHVPHLLPLQAHLLEAVDGGPELRRAADLLEGPQNRLQAVDVEQRLLHLLPLRLGGLPQGRAGNAPQVALVRRGSRDVDVVGVRLVALGEDLAPDPGAGHWALQHDDLGVLAGLEGVLLAQCRRRDLREPLRARGGRGHDDVVLAGLLARALDDALDPGLVLHRPQLRRLPGLELHRWPVGLRGGRLRRLRWIPRTLRLRLALAAGLPGGGEHVLDQPGEVMLARLSRIDEVDVRDAAPAKVFHDAALRFLGALAMVGLVAGDVDVDHGADHEARHIARRELAQQGGLGLGEAAGGDDQHELEVAQADGAGVAPAGELLGAGAREVPEPHAGLPRHGVGHRVLRRLVHAHGRPTRVATLHAPQRVDEQRLPDARVAHDRDVHAAVRRVAEVRGPRVVHDLLLELPVPVLHLPELRLPPLQLARQELGVGAQRLRPGPAQLALEALQLLAHLRDLFWRGLPRPVRGGRL